MKRIATALLCLIFGAGCFSGCTNTGAFTQKSYTAKAGAITEVCIDVRDRQIAVTPSADDQIHIIYFESSKEYYNISVFDGHSLTMSAQSQKHWTDYIGGKPAAGFRKITLQLPETLLTALELTTTNETISIAPLSIDGAVSVSTNGGDISFDELHVGSSVTLRAKNGTISGSLVGGYDDFAITCEIKKGTCNLPADKEQGAKTLQVFNNNGDVNIGFVGKAG